ncbi:AEC family transporter [Rossellomorea aquimaris]|uniref:AEC family transporter n=2 Tax=Rossellomorea TaxID=2837508 RepID=UPI001CD2FED0|nr:AEC family transporter [Rossellomorea aquimaris]MCA1059578.1 AEC family transporter [Rossellomorea aquimaris]
MDVIFIVLPALLVFLVGFIGQKKLGFEINSISKMAIYLMYPFLAFKTFYENELNMDYLYIFLFCIALCVILILSIKIVAGIRNYSKQKTSAMILSGVFMNSGNYGVPIILFGFGELGFRYAVIMMVIQSFLMNTIGLYYAISGSSKTRDSKDIWMKIVKMPILHGAVIGLAFQVLNLKVPLFLNQTIDLVSQATIPTIMVVLGMQLATLGGKKVERSALSFIVIMRMVASPILALAIVSILPISPTLSSILIILASMPTAANTTMFSLQFNTEPDLVSASTLVTTILSIVTIPIMLALVS